jgi:hypothetical protein
MFTSLALLARIPDELISLTPKTIHNKFKPFMKELGDKYIEAKKNNRPWRFIAEDYSDEDFAKALQNKMFLEEPLENIKNTKSQYEFLFNRANMIYKQEYEQLKKSRALSSIIDSTDPKQIAEALKLYKRSSI